MVMQSEVPVLQLSRSSHSSSLFCEVMMHLAHYLLRLSKTRLFGP